MVFLKAVKVMFLYLFKESKKEKAVFFAKKVVVFFFFGFHNNL